MKRYAVCGLSMRALKMYVGPLLTRFRDQGILVAMLDEDERRFAVAQATYPDLAHVPRYRAHQMTAMLHETEPDVIIVATVDASHVDYIVPALEANRSVISEKPLATTAADCRRILEAESRSQGELIVGFNYRYAPVHTELKARIADGAVGRVTSMEMTWLVDTYHGSSYFKRWNRDPALSGGLAVHKSSHHFDLLAWWTDQDPIEVFGYGALNYFGAKAPHNPAPGSGRHCHRCEVRAECAYDRRWRSRSGVVTVEPGGAEGFGGRQVGGYSGYQPDACIFDDSITIDDTYVATIRYAGGAMASYAIHFSAPYEGYRIAINGTEGRLETQYYHPTRTPFPTPPQSIEGLPLFGPKMSIWPQAESGDHEGGDAALLEDLFLDPLPSVVNRRSSARAGALAVVTGLALRESVGRGRPVNVGQMLEKG